MKTLGIIALAAVWLMHAQSQILGAPKEGTAEADQHQSQQVDSQNTHNTLGAIRQPSANADNEERENERRNLAIQRKIEWFTGVLALVGAIQGFVLYLTWKAIGRQAHLQAFLTRQWVDVGKWSIGGEGAWDIDYDVNRVERKISEKQRTLKNSMSMGVSFEIFNHTPYPLRLDKAVILIGKRRQRKWDWQTLEDKVGVVIAPNTSESSTVPFTLESEDEVFRYTKNCQYLRIHVRIFFFDSECNMQRQDFAVEAVFGERAFNFEKYSPTRAQKTENLGLHEEQGEEVSDDATVSGD